MLRTLTFLLLLQVVILPSNGQVMEIVSTSVAEGQTAVPVSDTLIFAFSKKLPFSSEFTAKFHWEPATRAFRRNIFLDEERLAPEFSIDHHPFTDFSVYIFGAEAEDGTRMTRPFVLNYTTLQSTGTLQVGGTVTFGERIPSGASPRVQQLVEMLHESLAASAVVDESETSGPQRMTFPRATGKRLSAPNIAHTVVFLLDEFSIDQSQWFVRGAATVGSAGTYQFERIRTGSYYPVAMNFFDDDGDAIGAYGFYDSDDDLNPDPIELLGGNLADIDIVLYDYSPSLARKNEPIGASSADPLATDEFLVSMSAFDVLEDGTAMRWVYDYYTPSAGEQITVVVDPIVAETSSFEFAGDASRLVPINAVDAIDSDVALGFADVSGGDAFRSSHPAKDVTVWLRGGTLYEPYPAEPARPVWVVDYRVTGPTEFFRVFVDMYDGSVLSTTATSTEELAPGSRAISLLQNYPNPFSMGTTIPFRIADSEEIRIDLFDLAGRQIETVAHKVMPPGDHEVSLDAGRLAAGVYIYRMSAGTTVRSRLLTVTR